MVCFLFVNILIVLFTTIGSFFVFKTSDKSIDKLLLFSIGIMISSTFFEMIFKAVDISKNIIFIGIYMLIGTFFIIAIENIKYFEKNKIKSIMTTMIIHNIPEGFIIGILFASASFQNYNMSSFMIFSLGIALQNIGDGMSVSIPLNKMGCSKKKSFWYGVITGLVEPIAAILGYILIYLINDLLPFMLSFAAGSTLYMIFNDLFSEVDLNNKKSIYIIYGIILIMIIENIFSYY